jgi:hypothetical protein
MKNPFRFVAAGLFAVACSSSPGTNGPGTAGSGNQGTAGTSAGSAGSSGGTSSTGTGGTSSTGTGGTSSTGTGGDAAGTGGSGTAGSVSTGSGGSGGSSGTTGQAGTGGGTGGRGGVSGSAGSAGAAGNTGNAGRGGSGTGGVAGSAAAGRGGAGASGGGGTTGAGGAIASPVTPTKNGNRYRFAWGDVVLEIDAAAGGRVATLSLGGADLIVPVPAANDPTTYGSVFWTSPRSAWTPQTWPPPVMIDSAMYNGGISGTHVVLDGPADTSIGVSMSKDYSADAATGWIKIVYTIHATKGQKAAPWEVSRVPRGGIVFFPLGSSVTAGPLTITQQSGTPKTVWFDDAPKTATSPNGDKLYADGAGSWEAYVLNGNMFLKRFADVPANMQPTGEGEIDVYPGNGFLEFEEQGPYAMIAAAGSVTYTVEWKAVKVPSSVSVAVSSTTLLDFAKQQVAQ